MHYGLCMCVCDTQDSTNTVLNLSCLAQSMCAKALDRTLWVHILGLCLNSAGQCTYSVQCHKAPAPWHACRASPGQVHHIPGSSTAVAGPPAAFSWSHNHKQV